MATHIMTDSPKTHISAEVYAYALNLGVHENPVLTKLREKTASLPNAIMQIPREQGEFMGILAKAINAKKYLEIGVFTGYSSLAMALHMGPHAAIVALDISAEFTNIAKEYWDMAGVSKQITLMLDDANISLEALVDGGQSGTFDMAFIDANKSDYLAHYEYCLKLVRKGGIILIDNTLFHNEVVAANPSNKVKDILEFNQFIYNDERVSMTLLPIADGLTIAYKK